MTGFRRVLFRSESEEEPVGEGSDSAQDCPGSDLCIHFVLKWHGHVEGYLEVFQAYIKVKQMILFSLKKNYIH